MRNRDVSLEAFCFGGFVMHRITLTGIVAVSLCCAAHLAHAAVEYNIVALDPLPGGESLAFGLNDMGQAVGDSRTDRFGNVGTSRPVVWDYSGTPRELWSDQNIGASLADINNVGQIVGRYGSGSGIPLPTPGVLPGRAFIWDPATGRQDLGIQPFGYSEAAAINDRGQVVGTSEVWDVVIIDGAPTLDNLRIHPFIWDAQAGIRDLGTLGGNTAFATDINNQGQVVGYSENAEGYTRAFVWDESQGMRELPAAGQSSHAVAINDLGQVLGDDFGIGAFIWDLPSGTRHAVPGGRDLNNLGQTVGGTTIWDETQGLRLLDDVIPPNSGWHIEIAFAINNAGHIVGYGTLNGQVRGFLMVPIPEPATMVQVILVLLWFVIDTSVCRVGFSRRRVMK